MGKRKPHLKTKPDFVFPKGNEFNTKKPKKLVIEWSSRDINFTNIVEDNKPKEKPIDVTNFLEVYKLPLQPMSDCDSNTKVMTDDFGMAFDFIPNLFGDTFDDGKEIIRVSSQDRMKIIRIINGADEEIIKPKNLTYKNGTIFLDDKIFIWIRGWGFLTGISGLNLDSDSAIKLQNDFAEYILKRLKDNCPNA